MYKKENKIIFYTAYMIKLKRVYTLHNKEDGYRILVDRLWPRGVTKEKAHLDMWLKDIAPSTELRKWFHHDPEKWTEFQQRYWTEIQENKEVFLLLKQIIEKHPVVTLLY